ncbi:collagen alpha-1(XV) chain-like [Portunus trituberculatus]|uniref:collagen alpha-1(XV) chain-like n=1 Tax=Portunus trituberculatus TaxID=210409 RepID=UPI001E1CBB51|nr:collagen alpha-1(XV) chain-like [Portunus trituberculatus]XP_045117510.1 collagen alpha-1(XV) chain-like [Portunus trituberculatus]
MRGVTGVEYTCYGEAQRAGLSGTFRAFLTSRIQNLDSIVRRDDANLPVVNIKGEVLFNTWRGIFSGDGGRFMQKPRIFSFDGKEVLTSPEWLTFEGRESHLHPGRNKEAEFESRCGHSHSVTVTPRQPAPPPPPL